MIDEGLTPQYEKLQRDAKALGLGGYDESVECEHGIVLGDECIECEMWWETVSAANRAWRDHSWMHLGAGLIGAPLRDFTGRRLPLPFGVVLKNWP